ncbi:MAG: hypothetical protein M1820_010815 [Bogoriella megaspora]|nr:MAG: hypothetical protein M1820_010815 [Bogoriella megaspora]
MATLNTSTNGPSITRSYQSVVDAPPHGNSPTFGQWAVFSVSAPLANAFQDSGKESVLKVQTTGEGELEDLIEEFSDGRIQFAFVKVKDTNTTLPKNVLIAWCGEGVPERTKGYFTSHLTAVSKLLHGYHVQVTARSDRDLTPESIIQKVADASGSKYSAGSGAPLSRPGGPPPPVSSKPVFTPTQIGGGASGFNPLGARTAAAAVASKRTDAEGWGDDAPPVSRSQIEKVQSAYQPTKVDLKGLTSQSQQPSRFNAPQNNENGDSDVVKGGYQPIGKVDIAAIRRQAQEGGQLKDDRPAPVKGSYEPVGKVDIAAIKSRAQGPSGISPSATGSSGQDDAYEPPKPVSERSAAFTPSERLTTLPKPKVANRFGSNTSSFTGTKAPLPGEPGAKPPSSAAPVGSASRTFADQGGKTPAQLWAEKKARERGTSGAADAPPSAGLPGVASPITSQTSGGGGWKSGYTGKSWAPVQTTKTGQSATSASSQQHELEEAQEESQTSPAGGISSVRDRFQGIPPMGAQAPDSGSAPPPMDLSSKPNAGAARGIPIPGLPARPKEPEPVPAEGHADLPPPPPQPPRSPTPEAEEDEPSSPVRIAMPVGRSQEPEIEPAHELPRQALPTEALSRVVPPPRDLSPEPQQEAHDPARRAAEAEAPSAPAPGGHVAGKRALIQYDYEKAEDNELELREGEYVENIEMVDEDWWMGQNARGETGLFPSNYVELVDDDDGGAAPQQVHASAVAERVVPELEPTPAAAAGNGRTAIASYDYEAAEDNELSFPEGAKITSVEFPDDDWWFGSYGGHTGLFPANYVELAD